MTFKQKGYTQQIRYTYNIYTEIISNAPAEGGQASTSVTIYRTKLIDEQPQQAENVYSSIHTFTFDRNTTTEEYTYEETFAFYDEETEYSETYSIPFKQDGRQVTPEGYIDNLGDFSTNVNDYNNLTFLINRNTPDGVASGHYDIVGVGEDTNELYFNGDLQDMLVNGTSIKEYLHYRTFYHGTVKVKDYSISYIDIKDLLGDNLYFKVECVFRNLPIFYISHPSSQYIIIPNKGKYATHSYEIAEDYHDDEVLWLEAVYAPKTATVTVRNFASVDPDEGVRTTIYYQ